MDIPQGKLEAMSETELKAFLETLPPDELFRQLEIQSKRLLGMVENIPCLILDGLDERLTTDEASAAESKMLFDRLIK